MDSLNLSTDIANKVAVDTAISTRENLINGLERVLREVPIPVLLKFQDSMIRLHAQQMALVRQILMERGHQPEHLKPTEGGSYL